MEQRRSSVRPLCRLGAVAMLVGASCVVGASAATAAEETPVVSLDPPDAEVLLLPVENLIALEEAGTAGGTPTDLTTVAGAVALGAALAAPELAETTGEEFLDAGSLGADLLDVGSLATAGVTAASHSGNGAVDVEYGGTLVVRLPPLVDATDAEVALGLLADAEDEPRVYSTDPAAGDPLQVDDLGGNEYAITLPADDLTNGPEAFLVFSGLGAADPGISTVHPLGYYLEFVDAGTGTATVNLEPTAGLIAAANCALGFGEPCPGPSVRPGATFDLAVPPSSLLRATGFGRLDTADVALFREDEETGETEEYLSTEDAGLLTRHDASRASVDLPDDMPADTWVGAVAEGDPLSAGGFAVTFFGLDVEAVPVNAGLHSDTGWVEDVRQVSADATKVVAGGVMLVVAACITAATVRPHRRPPAGG